MGSGDPPTGAAAASTCFPLHFDQLSSWLAATVNLSPWFLGPSSAPWNLPSGLVGFRGLPEPTWLRFALFSSVSFQHLFRQSPSTAALVSLPTCWTVFQVRLSTSPRSPQIFQSCLESEDVTTTTTGR